MEVEEKEANRIRIPRARQGRFVSVCVRRGVRVGGGEGREAGWGGGRTLAGEGMRLKHQPPSHHAPTYFLITLLLITEPADY